VAVSGVRKCDSGLKGCLFYFRKKKVDGKQDDYCEKPNIIGGVAHGEDEKEKSGCAVVKSNKDD
ncbi:hypothetical protein ACEF17_12640, partial [Streptococcus hyovaginalis]